VEAPGATVPALHRAPAAVAPILAENVPRAQGVQAEEPVTSV
jgi:hypothetical protein